RLAQCCRRDGAQSALARRLPGANLHRRPTRSDTVHPPPARQLPRALPVASVIVAHFFDVESGRKDLTGRGRSSAHERFDTPVPRDGGIGDLLAETVRPEGASTLSSASRSIESPAAPTRPPPSPDGSSQSVAEWSCRRCSRNP